MMKSQITAVILTKNEQENLPGCLESVSWVDKIVVVDDNSTDKTVEIAKKEKAEIFKRKLDDFSLQRNFALEKVKTPWVLFIDPDERLGPALREEMKKAIKSDYFFGYRFSRKNIIFGKWIKYSGWYPDWQIHLFKPGKAKYVEGVHEQVVIEGKVGELKNPLLHENYQSISQYLTKNLPYTSLEAEYQLDSGYQFFWSDLIRKPLAEFLRRFFAEEGYRDGIHGLALALLQAFMEALVYLKIWEKQKFPEMEIPQVFQEIEKSTAEIDYWLEKKSTHPFKKLRLKLKKKLFK